MAPSHDFYVWPSDKYDVFCDEHKTTVFFSTNVTAAYK